MAYNVSSAFREQLYSGESEFRAILTIGETTIDNDQIASISISSPIIDDSKQVFYVGTFISQKITIKFKNMDGIDVHSGDNIDLSIGQYVNNEWVDVPIGKFLVDDLAEDYYEKCEISCLDYAVKFKPNIDYSLCFTNGKATIKEILEYICDYFNVEIGDYPTINDDVEIGTYDSTVSGKQWISYIAELKGCNAKIDRLGRLTLQPLKQSSNVPINALESASFELGEEFNITKVTFFDAIRNYTYGDDEGNTLFIRQDNPFITDTKVVQNIYDNLCAIKYSASGKSFDIEDADAHPINVNTIYGETSQNGTPTPSSPIPINNVSGDNQIVIEGKNLFDMNIYSTTASKSNCTIEITDNAINITPTGNSYIGSAIKYPTYVNENNRPTCIRVKSSTKYTFSINNSGNSYVSFIDSNYQAVNTVDYPLNNLTSYTFTTPSNCKYVMFRLGKNSGTTPYSFEDIQLEENETATTYEAYTGATYNIDLPVENLFNPTATSKRKSNANSSQITNGIKISPTRNNGWCLWLIKDVSNYVGKKFSTRATFNGGKIAFVLCDANGYNLTTGVDTSSSDTNLTYTIPTLSSATYLAIQLWGNSNNTNEVSFTNIMVNEGATANSYTPYGTTPIELNKIGTYQDYITRNTGKNLFDSIIKQGKIGNNNYEEDSRRICTSSFIKVKPNTTYTISFQTTNDINSINISYFTSNSFPRSSETGWTSNFTFTTSSVAQYIQLTFRKSNDSNVLPNDISNIMINEGSTATEYEPYGKDEWYLKKEITKVVLDGTNISFTNRQGPSNQNNYRYVCDYAGLLSPSNDSTYMPLYCNRLTSETNNRTYGGNQGMGVSRTASQIITFINEINGYTLADANNWLKTHELVSYLILKTPTYEKITYQPLIDQLNALQNAVLFEGTNHITVDTLNEQPSLDIDYFEDSHFSLWSLKTHNYGDFTLDAWDNIDYDLDGTHYLTLNNNTIKYEMSIMSDVESKIPTKQQEVTTNVIGGDDKTNIKIIKTNVDQLNASVNILSQQQTDTQTDVSQLQIDVNGINTTVEHIENVEITGLQSEISSVNQTVSSIANLFQITGGINKIRNSAFLLPDEVWEFTDSGTNPEHTNLGNSYNSTLSGRTISIAEIKARSTKIKSKSENITDLKTDGTKYTFNFYHKQDVDTTTTIKMYSTENNNIKAFNDIVITGQQPFTNYEVSFVPTYTNYTLEIIIANATSIGYAYLYDMMLNSGDKQPWQPASDEIYSTTLQMSRLGLQVYSVGDGTLTILGSDGLTSWETSDGRTKGRLVSKRTVDGDRVKVVTTQSVKLVSDATKTDEELAQEDKWVETTTKVSGKIAKVIYMESGVQ